MNSLFMTMALLLITQVSLALPVADTLYVNGKIYSGEQNLIWADTLAVKDDRIVFVGSHKNATSFVTNTTKTIDLQGRLVLPGFYDLHVHPDLLFEPKYTNQIQTLPLGPKALKKAILEYAAHNPGQGWIFGGTWAVDAFSAAGIKPTAAFLDSFMPDRPLAILDTARHNMLVNSKAMKLAGIDESTFEPDHGVIGRDVHGKPNGMFSDGAQSLFASLLPQGNWQVMRESYREAQALLNQYGFVGARSQHVNTPRLQGVQALEREGALTVRYDMAISWKNDLHFTVPDRPALLAGERHRYRSKHVNANYVKFHVDGNAGSQSALYLDPYQGTQYLGKSNETMEELKALLVQLDKEGISVQMHVIGDGAARMVLDALEYMRGINGNSGVRHSLLHCYTLTEEDARRIGPLNVSAEFSYNFLSPALKPYMDYFVHQVLDPATVPRLLNIRTALDYGAKATFGSDLVVSPTPNIFPALAAMLARPDFPKKSITLHEAITMLTINGAWAMGREQEAGSLTAGKYADFVVLDRNWFEIQPKDIKGTKVVSTVFEGKEVYRWNPAFTQQ